jgi:hypothetical protein
VTRETESLDCKTHCCMLQPTLHGVGSSMYFLVRTTQASSYMLRTQHHSYTIDGSTPNSRDTPLQRRSETGRHASTSTIPCAALLKVNKLPLLARLTASYASTARTSCNIISQQSVHNDMNLTNPVQTNPQLCCSPYAKMSGVFWNVLGSATPKSKDTGEKQATPSE